VSVTKADGETLLTRVGQPATLVNQVLTTGDAYTYLQGTSMAAPAVSGAAALLVAADSGLSYDQVKAALLDHADRIAAAADTTVSGGRLNVWRSVCRVTNAPGDVTCDGTVDLADAITSLKLVAGRGADPLSPFPDLVDVDGDKSIGLAEAMYVLQSIAGLRE
jgi:subtilisin family serine protease